jgi:predicted DCC family thiol-disulfide oxidoreductase YuxK
VANDQPATKITAYYDGKCPMCAALINAVRRSPEGASFDLRDMHAQRSLPFPRAAVEKEIHLVDPDGQIHRGAQAILKIASRYPHLRTLAAAGQVSTVRPLLAVGYGFVAANRRFIFGSASRVFWLKILVVLVFCLGLIMSSRLWIGPRTYPVAPVFNLFSSSIYPLDLFMFAALFALAAIILVSSKPQKFLFAFLGIIGVFALLDQTRWQPWVFQYGFVLAALGLFSWDSEDLAGRQRTLNIVRLIVAMTYAFSGLQKLNLKFIDSEFPWIVEPITNVFHLARGPLYLFGIAAPFIQIGFAFGLMTQKYRKASLVLAVSMHLFILAMFGPFGHDWNNIIWPWTVAMAVLDILLFTSSQKFSIREIFLSGRYPFHVCVLVLFAILPFLSFFNLWDSYLSAALYSGNLTEGIIYANDEGKDSLPTPIGTYLIHTSPDTNVLNIQRWAIETLNVMPYPETRVYKEIAKAVCRQSRYPRGFVLLVHEQRMFGSGPEAGYRCWEL